MAIGNMVLQDGSNPCLKVLVGLDYFVLELSTFR